MARYVMEKYTLKQNGQAGNDLFRISGLICTASGKLLAYYECRNSESDWADAEIDIRMKTSADGFIWSSDRVLVAGKGVNNPIMFAYGMEVLFMWQEEYSRTFYRKSFDEGETWGEVTEITESLRTPEYPWTVIACGSGHGTVLKNGRYIVPIWLYSNQEDPKAHYPSVISTIYSDDKGKTWKIGELINKEYPVNPSETALAELADGSVMLNIRHESERKRRVIAYSDTGVGGWHNIHFEESFAEPVCMGSMAAHKGKVYFNNCNSEGERSNLTLYETANSGVTWKEIAVISQAARYSDIAISPDGSKIYILFEEFFYKCDKNGTFDRIKSLVFVSLDVSG